MSAHALMIVQEEFRKRRESIPDIHCSHDQLNTLEATILDQIRKECIEIPEELCGITCVPECLSAYEHAEGCPSLEIVCTGDAARGGC